ncbi:MAG: hypothetical protein V1646_00085 [bacterium]
MIYKIFAAKIYVSLIFVFATIPSISGMAIGSQSSKSSSTYPIQFKCSSWYTEDEVHLVELALKKIIIMVTFLKDADNKSKEVFDPCDFLENVRIFLTPDRKMPAISLVDYLNRFSDWKHETSIFVITLIYT